MLNPVMLEKQNDLSKDNSLAEEMIHTNNKHPIKYEQ